MGIVTYFLTLVDVQDEISMGFDRLVAMASEVDKRRKSAENSPAHNSPRKGEGKFFINLPFRFTLSSSELTKTIPIF